MEEDFWWGAGVEGSFSGEEIQTCSQIPRRDSRPQLLLRPRCSGGSCRRVHCNLCHECLTQFPPAHAPWTEPTGLHFHVGLTGAAGAGVGQMLPGEEGVGTERDLGSRGRWAYLPAEGLRAWKGATPLCSLLSSFISTCPSSGKPWRRGHLASLPGQREHRTGDPSHHSRRA